MITILYLETGSGYGGSAQSLYQLLSAIDRTRFRPIVAAYSEGSGIRRIGALDIPVRLLPGPRSVPSGYGRLLAYWAGVELPRTLRLMRIIRRERVDMVHLNTDLYGAMAGLWAAKLMRRPLICHLRLTRRPTRLERLFGKMPNYLVVLTQHGLNYYRPFWPRQRIRVVYDAVDAPPHDNGTANGLRKELGLSDGAPLVGLIGRCVPGKGHGEFIQAAAIVSKRCPEARFLIVGNGPCGKPEYEAKLRRLVDELRLNGTLIWVGWRDDLQQVLGELDVVAQVSTSPEGFGRVAIEAMASGTPVIATSLPVFAEVIGNAGWLVPPGDVKALAQGVQTLLEDRPHAQRLVAAGKQRVRNLFSLEAHARTLERIYDEVLTARNSGQ